ncbi:MAG: glycine--tRNA ligase, partial [Candidatus Aenigmarchaeota archaeon]|nr:glycine--tRNA ligase [Candidatus Aenigmarchaeota archaeon]
MSLEKVEELAKRRGFFWQSSEIYGGLGGFYDYGHLGAEVKRRFENLWRDFFLRNAYEIEPAHIMHEKVFIASGHAKNFADPIAKCRKCKTVHRADHILEEFLKESFEGLTPEELGELIKKHNIKCSNCKGPLEPAGTFNMMFPLDIGVENPQKAFLRPETAQGVYVNFRRIFEQTRRTLPLGIACVSKAYRNEISPRQLLMRMREFTQAELQIFLDPEKMDEAEIEGKYKLNLLSAGKKEAAEMTCEDAIRKLNLPRLYVHYMSQIQKFYLDIVGIDKNKFRFRELPEEERAFYNKIHWDVELAFSDTGFKEVAGLHYRTDHDLAAHARISNQSMEVVIDGKRFVPHVLEVSFGIDRNVLFLL